MTEPADRIWKGRGYYGRMLAGKGRQDKLTGDNPLGDGWGATSCIAAEKRNEGVGTC